MVWRRPYFFFEVDDRAGVVKSDLNRIDDEVRAAQCLLAVFRAEVFFDGGSSAVELLVHFSDQQKGLFESFRVDVIKCNFRIVKFVAQQGVADDVFGEDGASRTHKGQFHTNFLPIYKDTFDFSAVGGFIFIITHFFRFYHCITEENMA